MNKKILSFFAALAIFTMFAVPVSTLAQAGAPDRCKITKDIVKTSIANCPGPKDKIPSATAVGECPFSNKDDVPCAVCCLFNSLYAVIDWVFAVIMIVVALMIIAGAATFVTSAGDPNKTGQAKNYILWAVIGLIVALFAKAIPPLVRLVIGVKSA
ncbi:MAG: hypothetical protein WC520_03675 [Candidatus Paceibacterota bacterium]